MTQSDKKRIWIAAGCLLAFTIFIIGVAVFSKGQPAGVSGQNTVPAISATDHVLGSAAATVTLIEYGDFQCPACAQYEAVVKQVQKEYAGTVLFVFRNFPLYQAHPNAGISSQAAEAAGMQGKYWEMHDMLYTKQTEWAPVATNDVVTKYFAVYAQSLGLDVDKFKTDIQSAAVKAKIAEDVASANAARVDHTPTFFINLKEIKNPNTYAEFKSILDAALATTTVQ